MNELFFRVLFSALWIIFVVGLALVRYSTREHKGKQPSDQLIQHERRLYIITRALLAPFWWAGIILFLVFPSWVMFLSIPLPDWFRLIMVGIASLSILLTLWSWRTLGKNWVHCLDPSEFQHRKTTTLVTSGPYHYVRHPMYLGAFTFLIAQALVAANWLILLPALVTTTLFYMQIGKEEAMLIDRFGNQYREYMKKTPRLIPKPKHH
jgi:protein-S-isoprenylcysteine O-methyltransferase Ste14